MQCPDSGWFLNYDNSGVTATTVTADRLKLIVKVQCWGWAGCRCIGHEWTRRGMAMEEKMECGPRGPGGRPAGPGEGKTTWWRVPARCEHTLGPYRRGGWGFCGCHLGPREECLTMLQKKWKSSPAIVPGKKRVAGAECSRRTAKECMSCLRAMARGPDKDASLCTPQMDSSTFLHTSAWRAAREVDCHVQGWAPGLRRNWLHAGGSSKVRFYP